MHTSWRDERQDLEGTMPAYTHGEKPRVCHARQTPENCRDVREAKSRASRPPPACAEADEVEARRSDTYTAVARVGVRLVVPPSAAADRLLRVVVVHLCRRMKRKPRSSTSRVGRSPVRGFILTTAARFRSNQEPPQLLYARAVKIMNVSARTESRCHHVLSEGRT